MKEQYVQYLRLRHDSTPEGDSQRLRIKADLARDVSTGQGQWYRDRLNTYIAPFHTTYGEIASRLSDTRRPERSAEPSLAQAVLATEQLQADYEDVRGVLLPHSRALIKVGSTSWAENFDVRNHGNPSDLDLEVLIDGIHPEEFAEVPGAEEALSRFGEVYDDNQADYMAFSWKKGDRPVSIHFMPTDVFEDSCRRDYFSDPQNRRLREFRVKPKSKAPRYEQRDGFGNSFLFDCQPTLVPQGQITETPLMMVGDQGQLVLGLVMDKYFSLPKVDGDEDFFNDNIGFFKRNLAAYLAENGGSFSGFPSRRNRMPYWLLEDLDKEQLCLK